MPTSLALTRGRHDRFPILELAGRRIGDSTAIIAALEAAHPTRRSIPPTRRSATGRWRSAEIRS